MSSGIAYCSKYPLFVQRVDLGKTLLMIFDRKFWNSFIGKIKEFSRNFDAKIQGKVLLVFGQKVDFWDSVDVICNLRR